MKNFDCLSVEFYKYSKRFLKAANEVMKNLLTDAKQKHDISKLDTWFFPVIYLYRQSLELLLKAIIFKYITDESEQKSTIGNVSLVLYPCIPRIAPCIVSVL